MSRECRIITLPDGTKVRAQGDADPEFIQALADKVRADEARRCHALSEVPMPEVAQRIHGRETYWCGLYAGHDGPHRWPEDGSRTAEQPAAMLVARATSELARLIASDAILGVGYSAEEVADGGAFEQQVGDVTTTPTEQPATRKMSRRKPKPANEDGSPAPDVEGQMKAMHAAFNEAGITERQDRLDFAMGVVNREITSSSDLTWDERSDVIDELRTRIPEPPLDAELVEDAS